MGRSTDFPRFFRVAILAFHLVLATVAGVRGQPLIRGTGGGVEMLTNGRIHAEVKATPDQAMKMADLRQSLLSDLAAKMRQMSERTPERKQAEFRRLQRLMIRDMKASLVKILDPKQYGRFDQVRLQLLGIRAFTDDEAASRLALTSEQKTRIRAIEDGLPARQGEVYERSQGDVQKAIKGVERLSDTAVQEAVTLLNEEQARTWRNLVGEPFDTSPPASEAPKPR